MTLPTQHPLAVGGYSPLVLCFSPFHAPSFPPCVSLLDWSLSLASPSGRSLLPRGPPFEVSMEKGRGRSRLVETIKRQRCSLNVTGTKSPRVGRRTMGPLSRQHGRILSLRGPLEIFGCPSGREVCWSILEQKVLNFWWNGGMFIVKTRWQHALKGVEVSSLRCRYV